MSESMMILWSLLALVGFTGSALYSGMETGAYSLNRVRLHVYKHQHHPGAATLHRLLADPTTLLSTLLIGNNITNYLGTAAMGVILASMPLSEGQTILLNALIVTPILFVVGETLPKDLFAAYCDRLMYRLAPVLTVSRVLFTYCGLVPLITLFSHGLMRVIGRGARATVFHPRRQVGLLVREGVGYGLLSQEQSAIVDRVLEMADRAVRDEMTPWAEVVRLRDQDDTEAVWRLAKHFRHAHIPVLTRGGKVRGVLRLDDALTYGKADCPPIIDLVQPAPTVPQTMPVNEALGLIKTHAAGLAIVTGAAGQPVGVITVKDLIEPITGDLRQW